MSKQFRFLVPSFILLALIGGVYLFLRSPLAISLDQSDQTARLLAPFSASVPFQLDPSDTAMSPVQRGEPVRAASFDGDVRSLPQIGPTEKTLGVEFEWSFIEGTDPNFVDPVVQDFAPALAIPGASANFAGLDLNNWGAGWPPDTQADVGPNHVIQAVNTSIGIYSKTGTQLAAFTFDALFAGTGTPCDADNNGDPVVLYDHVSGRWIVSDFAWTNIQNGPYYECIAVSKTTDPVSGGWWFYGLRADDATHPWLNDYPKMGVWGDGIYMTANMFDCLTATCSSASYRGVRLWALNRDNLINGQPLSYQFADLGTAYFSLLPANADRNTPPLGTPNYLGSLQTTSSFNTWKLSIDWNNVANSTLTGPVSTTIASFSNASSVPQPAGTNLDSLAGRLMAQLQYSNVSGTPALWVTHSVSTSGRAGVRWYEFRNLSGTPSVFQQGTFSPDTTHRWMGSVAVDSQGNMAVVYSASSTSLSPSVRYAGRLAGDPLGQLSQGEATLIAGTGSQTTYTRWGDYSAMGLDPDGCTFWFTTEYYASTGTNWQTRIGSFKFPGCGGPAPTPTNTAPPPTATNTPPPPTPTATPNPAAAVHVGDLDGSSTPTSGGRWNASVTITVLNQNGSPVAGATVSGSWSNGASGSGNCTTNASGQCTVVKTRNKNTVNSVTFTVTAVTASGYSYNPAANTDPDGDSNGTVIVVAKP